MKKLLAALLFGFSVFMVSCDKDDDQTLTNDNIPTEIKNYVTTHFNTATITRAVIDEDDSNDYYEITLSNGVKLDFNRNKQIVDIESNTQLPDSVIPDAILSYVKANYASNFITDWELQGIQQEVELNNGVELIFTATGEFVRIDN